MMCARLRSEIRYFSSTDVDGFPLVEGEVAAYCPRQKRKITLHDHEQCQYFQSMEEAELLGIVALRCKFESKPQEDIERAGGK